MTFRIEKTRSGSVTTVRLIGRLLSVHIEELKKHIAPDEGQVVLDLAELTLVDLDVVRFLNVCKKQGAKVANASAYIRKWMLRERELES